MSDLETEFPLLNGALFACAHMAYAIAAHPVGSLFAISGPWSSGDCDSSVISAETHLTEDEVAEHTTVQVLPGVWANGWMKPVGPGMRGTFRVRDSAYDAVVVGKILDTLGKELAREVSRLYKVRFVASVTHRHTDFATFVLYDAPFTLTRISL